eukprot:scaffold152965_cov44-Prasinocladus_malaysianus.AAC.1
MTPYLSNTIKALHIAPATPISLILLHAEDARPMSPADHLRAWTGSKLDSRPQRPDKRSLLGRWPLDKLFIRPGHLSSTPTKERSEPAGTYRAVQTRHRPGGFMSAQ